MENNSKSYKVVIYNQTYSLRSDHGPEYIHKLAEYVDKRMNEIASKIAVSVAERSTATQEMSRNIAQAATGTQEVSSNIDSVKAAANETGRVSSAIVHAATDLDVQATSLRTQVDSFIARVRAA